MQHRPLQALTPMSRPGEFEVEHEIHSMRTRAFLKQVRRIVSLERHLKRRCAHDSVGLRQLALREWKAVIAFWFDGAPFTHWMSQWPELWPVPWNCPSLQWIAVLRQLVQFSLKHMVSMDHRVWEAKQSYYRLQDKRFQNHEEAFRKVKGSTPQIRETRHLVEQRGLAVPQPDYSFVEIWCEFPRQFSDGYPVYYAGHGAKILEIWDSAILVSFVEDIEPIPQEGDLVQTLIAVAPGEMFEHLNHFWLPLWQRDDPEEVPLHQAQEFEFFLSALDPFKKSLDLDISSTQLWIDGIRTLKTRAAPGMDGVRASELQLLPRGMVSYLAILMNSCTDGFPSVLMESRTIPLPKVADNITASAVRPITILSQLYRLWGHLICRQVLAQWSKFFPNDITGLLAGRSSFSAAYLLQWQLEQASFQNLPAAGLTLDICKCFNMISRISGYMVLQRLGLPITILSMWWASLSRMTRRWELWGEVSNPMAATCGFPEGDIFSVLVMLAIALTWTATLRRECGRQLSLSAYADNWTWSSPSSGLFSSIIGLTLRWTALVGMIIDWKKTWYWATCQNLAHSLDAAMHRLGTPAIRRVTSANDLGCPLRYTGKP